MSVFDTHPCVVGGECGSWRRDVPWNSRDVKWTDTCIILHGQSQFCCPDADRGVFSCSGTQAQWTSHHGADASWQAGYHKSPRARINWIFVMAGSYYHECSSCASGRSWWVIGDKIVVGTANLTRCHVMVGSPEAHLCCDLILLVE